MTRPFTRTVLIVHDPLTGACLEVDQLGASGLAVTIEGARVHVTVADLLAVVSMCDLSHDLPVRMKSRLRPA